MHENREPGDITVDFLKAGACKIAHLEEWGDEDFQLPLQRLIRCYDEKYIFGTDKMRDFYFQNGLRSILVNRLYIEDNYRSHPEIKEVALQRPLFIVGLPRTGSTLLHRLLSRDLSSRVIRFWEMTYPFYGPNVGLNHEEITIKLAELKIKEIYSRVPDLISIHQVNATDPEECNILMRHTFCSLYLANEWLLPQYAYWVVSQDITGSYRYFRKLLQLLFWHKPGKFLVLKCPSHLLNIISLFEVFPDANILWLHRDPVKTIPSHLSLLSLFWGENIRNTPFMEFILDYSRRSLAVGMETEKKVNPSQWLDLRYKELVEDPVSAVLKIYNYFHYEIGSRMEEDMLRWRTENPQFKHGVHTYSLEEFGLSEGAIRERFARYYAEYGHLL